MTAKDWEAVPPDVDQVLSGLKPFQRDTVDYVFRRLYLDADKTHRFLIADEVGLGKTLVARGVIARAVQYLWDKVDRIDIVYVCSNVDIAHQNISRLKLGDYGDFASTSRLTLLPTVLHELNAHKVNFISFTPSTSFDLKSRTGIAQERALLYNLLGHAWRIEPEDEVAINILRVDADADGFQYRVQKIEAGNIDQTLERSFLEQLEAAPELRRRFKALYKAYRDGDVSYDDRHERRALIGDLRKLLANTCLAALKTDLIILDEFQRFKKLIDPENEEESAVLARSLFEYYDPESLHDGLPRIILLSATPYKMYTLSGEDEDHYEDFCKTYDFLETDKNKQAAFREQLANFRHAMYRIGQADAQLSAAEIKRAIQAELRRVMVRTERLAIKESRDGMLQSCPPRSDLQPQDLTSYLALAEITRLFDQDNPLEYWKSAPYLFNFMDKEAYKLKRKFIDVRKANALGPQIVQTLNKYPSALLNWSDIETYQTIDPGNARLRTLIADTLDAGAWKLLWISPSLPYYQLAGSYAESALARFTKRLVFSAWQVVPDVITTLLSYEAERRMIGSSETNPRNTPEERRRRAPLLRFAISEARPTGMSVLGLIYPCLIFARRFDPRKRAVGFTGGDVPTREVLLAAFERDIAGLLRDLKVKSADRGAEDEQWYWAAPIMLDLHYAHSRALAWFNQADLAGQWSGATESLRLNDDAEDEESAWDNHVERAKELVKEYESGRLHLGRPPADLARVLAEMALGGLGVCLLRALSRVGGGDKAIIDPMTRNHAASAAKACLALFNLPESIGMIRGLNKSGPYWHQVLEYCGDGCLQSVLDEYAHVLPEYLGIVNEPPLEIAARVAKTIGDVISLRTTNLGVDDLGLGRESISIFRERLRGRFALRFGDQPADAGEEVMTRADQVRTAFNSPFWPFVLATTSVGQEGLDFHLYCHAVVHWNLPSNPVDLEQREGRVHRYKGHAVRRNLARKWGIYSLLDEGPDLWRALFELGAQGVDSRGGLVPFWIYTVDGGYHIERHVLALPLSRDIDKIEALRRSLAVYRMVFGQNRQEDLIQFLLSTLKSTEVPEVSQELWIDLSPPSGTSRLPSCRKREND